MQVRPLGNEALMSVSKENAKEFPPHLTLNAAFRNRSVTPFVAFRFT